MNEENTPYTALQTVLDCLGAFRTVLQEEFDMFPLFGIHISWFDVLISLFVVGTICALLGFEFEED